MFLDIATVLKQLCNELTRAVHGSGLAEFSINPSPDLIMFGWKLCNQCLKGWVDQSFLGWQSDPVGFVGLAG
jgi:hypothetical protein